MPADQNPSTGPSARGGSASVTENAVRVLVANRPRLLREMVLSTLSEQVGINVVGEAEDERDIPELVEKTRPDFLLIGMDEGRKRFRHSRTRRCQLRTQPKDQRQGGTRCLFDSWKMRIRAPRQTAIDHQSDANEACGNLERR